MWEIIGFLLVVALIVAAWMFIVPATAALGGMVAIVLGNIASFKGILRGVTDTFEEDTDGMYKLYHGSDEPAKQSWFFGPCFSVFPLIFRHSFDVLKAQSGPIFDKWLDIMDHGLLAKIFFAPIGAVLLGMTWAVGTLLSLFWAVVFCVLFLIALGVFYIFFGIVKLIDGIILRARGLKNHCPNCNELSLVPEFVCPDCGSIHKKLTPNRYGVFNHQCTCGSYLGATYFTGKSHLHSICPHCGEPFKTGATRPLTLQLVGGTSAGKTVYLAALFSEIHALSMQNKVGIRPDPACKDGIEDLIYFAAGRREPQATQGRDVSFYAEVVNMGPGKTPVKLEVVDIPGEMFAGETALQEGIHRMAQYNYADGFIFLVDPYSDGDLANDKPSDGTEISPVSSEEVLNSFDQYLIAQKFAKTGQLITKPISVVVVKSDTERVKKELTMEMIQEAYEANPALYKNSFDNCRDEMIKEMLSNISMSSVVNNITSRFKNVHFFLASSMGHAPEMNKPYKPQQVLESAEWMWGQANPAFLQRMKGQK